MTNRYTPNEVTAPVPLELLALLLRSDEAAAADIVRSMPEAQRASLAAFCFSRSHMRALSFRIAAHCEPRSLRLAAGVTAEALIEQSRMPTNFDAGPMQGGRRKITLAKAA